MALIEWNPTFSVKVKKFDDQHKKLIGLINQLHDAMKAGQGQTQHAIIFQSLINYAATHFKDEEEVMQANGYPDLVRHKAEHEKLVNQVLDLQNNFQTQAMGAVVTTKIMNFLKEWLVTHILAEDHKYSAFLNAKGIH